MTSDAMAPTQALPVSPASSLVLCTKSHTHTVILEDIGYVGCATHASLPAWGVVQIYQNTTQLDEKVKTR